MVLLYYLIRIVFNLLGRNGVIGKRIVVVGYTEGIWLSNRNGKFCREI